MAELELRTVWLFDRTAKLTPRQKTARREVRKLERIMTAAVGADELQRQIVTAVLALGAAEHGTPGDVPRLVAQALRNAADEVERSWEDTMLDGLRKQL